MEDSGNNEPRIPRLRTGPMRVLGVDGSEKAAKPWDARKWLTEKTGGGAAGGGKKEHRRIGTITIQAIVCGFVIVGVLVLKAVKLPETSEVLAGLDSALTMESGLDRALGRLNFVGGFFSSSQAVFNPEEQGLVKPVVDMTAVNTGQDAVQVSAADSALPVLAAADGQVFYSGASAQYGTVVIIRHPDGYETRYGGLVPEVKAGKMVIAGERIGTIQNATLTFEAYRDGTEFDPRPYLRNSGT